MLNRHALAGRLVRTVCYLRSTELTEEEVLWAGFAEYGQISILSFPDCSRRSASRDVTEDERSLDELSQQDRSAHSLSLDDLRPRVGVVDGCEHALLLQFVREPLDHVAVLGVEEDSDAVSASGEHHVEELRV